MCDIKKMDLKKLLAEWKLENIFPHLTDENIDIEILEMMKAPHIRLLLYKFPLGVQIRFEYHLEQWRCKIGKPLKFNGYDANNEFPTKEGSEKYFPKTATSQQMKNTNRKQDTTPSINLKEILNFSAPDGPELIDIYQKNQTFSSPERSHLINIIVNYYLKNDLFFNLYISYDLENAILAMFTNERLDMYRSGKEGKIYLKYLSAKAVYNKETSRKTDNLCTGEVVTNEKRQKYQEEAYDIGEEKNISTNSTANCDVPTEILLQTLHMGCKKFVKIFEPYSLQEFLSAACSAFKIVNNGDLWASVNECEISETDFKTIILQYYKLPTFAIELKGKEDHHIIPDIQLTKLENFENSCSPSNSFSQSNTYPNHSNSFVNSIPNNSDIQIIYNHLPDANDIRNIPSLMPIVSIADSGKSLENKHRTAIAKAIIDECLNLQPGRILKRQDFFTLTENLVQAFPNEVASAYFVPSQPNHAARGKLWNAYTNKRSYFLSSGVLQRRQYNMKRKHQSDQDEESEKTSDKVFVTGNVEESVEFGLNSQLEWNTIQDKWSECHRKRRNELLRLKVSPHDYLQKYSILKSTRGIDLMEIDVNILHPTVANINNWLSLYDKVIEMSRKMRKIEMIPKVLEAIGTSSNEKYCASLALLLIPYIFPYNGRRNETNERASKCEIQERFIKEYATMDDLKSDVDCVDLQMRFVHQDRQITYAEFSICGHIFKCVDLLEALSSLFHYIMALNLEYPKICQHIWQFIQLAIFQIEIEDCLQPNVQSTINDLYML